ncbi:MAG TPA: Gfo/Idh/MocA family oxidoreductase, partial [bacterium]|nr:Gfo/Idh/MocA family oxidoreductase [bacterium]
RCHPCTHSGGYYFHNSTKLIAGCDTNSQRLEYFGRKWNIPQEKLYSSYKKLLEEQKDIDILSIASDTPTHFEILKHALNIKNIKAILLEKPIVAKISEANELELLISKTDKKIFINHERRFMTEYKFVKKLIKECKFKKLKTMIGNVLTSGLKDDWHSDWRESGGGPLLHDGTHLVDILNYFADSEIDCLTGWIKFSEPRNKYQVENSANAQLQYKNGIIAFIESAGDRNFFNFEIDLQFENGRIKIGNGIWEVYEVQASRQYEHFFDLVRTAKITAPPSRPFFLEIVDEIIKSIEDDNYKICSSPTDALNAFWAIMAIYYSGLTNNQKIKFPFKIDRHPFDY